MKWFNPESDPNLFACPCGNCDSKPSQLLLSMLDAVREYAMVPMSVTSGPRCWDHNAAVGGSQYSEHMDGDAADIACTSSRQRALILDAARRYGVNRIGVAHSFVHLGVSKKHDQDVTWVYR